MKSILLSILLAVSPLYASTKLVPKPGSTKTGGGGGSVTYPLKATDGSSGAPSYSFNSAQTKGFFYDTPYIGVSGDLNLQTNANVRFNSLSAMSYNGSNFQLGDQSHDLYVDGGSLHLTASNGNTMQLQSTVPFFFFNPTGNVHLQMTDSGSNYLDLSVPSVLTANRNIVLPGDDPSAHAGEFVTTDASGNWSYAPTGGSVSFPLLGSDGGNTAPTYSFASDTDTGMWRGGSGTIIFSTNSNNVMAIVSTDIEPTQNGSISLGVSGARWNNGYINYLYPQAIFSERTVTPGGTTGDQTINKMSGVVNIAAAGTSITVTNSLILSSDVFVTAIAKTNDATCAVKNVVPTTGSFTINMTAACTAETAVAFLVVN